MDKLKKKITTAFKLSGYVIRSENSTYLAEQLLPFDPSEHDKWLTTVIENIQNLKITSTNIDRAVIEKAIVEINRVGLQEHETIFDVIDAFKAPRFIYNLLSRKFELDKKPRSLLADGSMQVNYLLHRYNMLYQKTIRHELFSPTILEKSSGEEVKKFKLLNVENLLSSTEVKEAVILGQLNQIEERKLFIEDPTGYVEVDLSAARYHAGFFCEGMFVLAEGSYDNNIFKVDGLGFPPAEPASSSRAFFGTANSWGGPSEKLLKYSVALQEAERTNTEATMVFLADVQLDLPDVLSKLRKLFVGYDSCPPVCIVLMGPFSTTTHNYYELIPLFKQLAEAANGCDQLKKETDLILVPHPKDPISSDIFPRHGIPPALCKDLLKAWPRTKLVSNPCRLQYCTQQILILRLDLMARMARNTIHFPDKKNIDSHFARTIICQGHLTPFGKYVNPIYWDYDTSMWLYPLPDLVVIGDTCQSFSTTQHGCTILNTGSFPKSNFSFKMYIPSTKTIEDSEIPDGFEDEDARSEEEPEEEITEDYIENRVLVNNGINKDLLNQQIMEEEDSTTIGDSEIVSIDDSEIPSVSGLGNRDEEEVYDEEPSVSGLNKPEAISSLTEEEERQIRLIEELELESDSSDEF
ncbi:DNA polymerase epsilon subunit 2 [Episyrphus balteatus]|uniref:DNA polymerase epsilon subunit 2 n=1 Tax=Episyrphus balteatus TaxID=286459 RepID=UPI0024859352|nr:DNA polymerase epsilon subunit 2 [Episyrphus balteatus]